MSFILDALKKSESDRQRQNGPALFEVKVAPPRRGLPGWALAIAALLLVNIVIIAWVLLRHPGAHAAVPENDARDAAAAAPPAASAQAPAPAPAAAPAPALSAPAPLSASAAAPGAAPAGTPAPPAAGAAAAGSAAPAAPPGTATEEPNPDDFAPAAESASASLSSHVRRGTDSGVPLYQDQAATPGVNLPQLRLDLHVYAVHPQDRFVMINMRKLREGDSLPDGTRVESITPEGAVLSHNGSRFMLPRE